MTTAIQSEKTEKKSRRGRPKANKVAYRSGDDPLLREIPDDFDPAKHKPLDESDFHEEEQYIFWEEKVRRYKRLMSDDMAKAELCRRFPTKAERDAYMAVQSKASKLAQLVEQLGGVENLPPNVADLLANLSPTEGNIAS
jgi:hypothetical protein